MCHGTLIAARRAAVAALLDSDAAGDQAANQDVLVHTLGNKAMPRTKDAQNGAVKRPEVEPAEKHSFDILLPKRERIPTEPDVGPVSLVGSSHNRLTSAEDNEEALLSGYPPVGLLDAKRIKQTEKNIPDIPA
jgi:hypothetical protein